MCNGHKCAVIQHHRVDILLTKKYQLLRSVSNLWIKRDDVSCDGTSIRATGVSDTVTDGWSAKVQSLSCRVCHCRVQNQGRDYNVDLLLYSPDGQRVINHRCEWEKKCWNSLVFVLDHHNRTIQINHSHTADSGRSHIQNYDILFWTKLNFRQLLVMGKCTTKAIIRILESIQKSTSASCYTPESCWNDPGPIPLPSIYCQYIEGNAYTPKRHPHLVY
jgi:hypothetical protein